MHQTTEGVKALRRTHFTKLLRGGRQPKTCNLCDYAVMACQFCPGLVSTVVLVTDVPFMVQITGVPLVFWNRMSALPSPVYPPGPGTPRSPPPFPTPATAMTPGPFISPIAMLPGVSCQTMSALPSPLKSPMPCGFQLVPTLPRPATSRTDAPFISHIARLP